MNYSIEADSFQIAWAQAICALKDNGWVLWNLLVKIRKPLIIDDAFHQQMTSFAESANLIKPNQVAYTIFPFGLCMNGIPPRSELYRRFWRYFRFTRTQEHRGWGTYFERMIRYAPENIEFDQLGFIIDKINNREKVYKAAYLMVIPYPYKDSRRTRGGPCLNYVTIQLSRNQRNSRKVISLLAVYRNHDFVERAYGNYLGLCKLLEYIAHETDSDIGSLACLSSHAFVLQKKSDVSIIASQIIGTENGSVENG